MNEKPVIAVLCGGVSAEREVSISSGRSIVEPLKDQYPTELFVLDGVSLPAELDAQKHVIFPVLHGTFGEDGQLQARLEEAGFFYAGSGERASRLCFNKQLSKDRLASKGIPVLDSIAARVDALPSATSIVAKLGENVVVKPVCEGSSVGLELVRGVDSLREISGKIAAEKKSDFWLFERRVFGREITVGVLNGKGMGLVEVVPKGHVYDYEHKYTPGMTEYRYPAELDASVESGIREAAENAYTACGCRDFARVDFMLESNEEWFVLEINTLPGLTSTSLLPKSALCFEMDYSMLALRLVNPAVERFLASVSSISPV